MPQRPAVTQLPEEVRRALEARLVQGGFAGYTALAEWLTEQGYEISKSSLHRYGQTLERKLSAIKASTQAAQLIAEAAPDEEDARSAAVISLVQTDLFEALLALQEAGDAEPAERVKLLSSAARSIADVGRASVSQKRFASEVKARAAQAAEDVVATVKKGGLSDDAAAAIRRQILGIAP
ncbi:MAG: DUF3486 family protein [Acidobacteriota bacterium]